jgi:circadian clock protein KaiC
MTREEIVAGTSVPVAKAATGIAGLDEITQGGFPAGRPTLVCGGPGCGKTVLAMEFLVRGAQQFGEPGLFVSFEENPQNLVKNFRSFGFDLDALVKRRQLKIVHVALSRKEIIETGNFSLDALLIRIEQGIKEVGAKRVALDTMETIFAALSNSDNLRSEIADLFHWLRDRGVTAIVTGEKGKEELTRHGFEEYLSDCVLLLDHRIDEQTSKRRIRIIKYRGTAHGKDEYPFLIGATGFSVLPTSSLLLDQVALSERVSTGVAGLDQMVGGNGYFKGSTVLVSGKAGTGKSTLAAAFVAASCARNERCLYFAFEESAAQLSRNMRSVGIDLESWLKMALLTMQATRPTFFGLEEHLESMISAIDRIEPACVVIDPITDFLSAGAQPEIKAMLIRVIDYLKSRGITLLATALTAGSGRTDETAGKVSSLVDTWIALDLEVVGYARRREIYVVKSRGMEHSQETCELLMSSAGLSVRGLKSGEK